MLSIVPVAAIAYLATNLDNLTLFVLLLTAFRTRRSGVIAGYLAGAVLLGGTGFVLGRVAETVPIEYIGFLGFIPLSLGMLGVGRLIRGKGGVLAQPGGHRGANDGHSAVVTTVISQLGNGSDTIFTYGALFADSMPAADLLIIFTLICMALLFVLAGSFAVSHPAVVTLIDRYAHRVTPFLLMAVGGYILANTVTDVLADY